VLISAVKLKYKAPYAVFKILYALMCFDFRYCVQTFNLVRDLLRIMSRYYVSCSVYGVTWNFLDIFGLLCDFCTVL
jgi:hypothetical protein